MFFLRTTDEFERIGATQCVTLSLSSWLSDNLVCVNVVPWAKSACNFVSCFITFF
jgi:hypothetical protein